MNKNLRYLWLILATVLSLFIGGKWNIPLAAWIAPVFIIRFFRDSEKAGRNFLLLWLASSVPTMIAWNGTTFFPPFAEAAFFIVITPISLLPYVVDRLYARRFPKAAWVSLVFPVAYTAVDFFSSSGSPFGTFGAVAYSQRGFLPVMQLASITGLWGITFVIGWFAGLANHIWENGFKFTRFALVSSCILLTGFLFGFGRILLKPQPEQNPIIAGFSLPNETMPSVIGQFHSEDETGFRQTVDKLNANQLEQIRTMAQDGANIVVLQEGAIMGMIDQIEAVMHEASIIAVEENIYIVLPTFDLGKSPAENKVHIIDPNGEVILTHIKYGGNQFEGTLKGDGVLQTLDTPYGKFSAVICWDADFPNVIKQAGEQKVDLLFIPSNDWLSVKDIHTGMATFRAVENGMTVYRQVGQGVSIVVDAYGKEYNRVDSFDGDTTGFTNIQTVATPVGSVDTLYTSLGDLFGNVMLLGFVGLLVGLFLTRKMNPTA